MRSNALWWWIDRWRKSTAFTDMTLEAQGAYRNLLDEATLRGGALPNDDRILAKACGDATAWRRLRDVVMARFDLRDDGWHHETLDEVLHQSKRRREKQARYRSKSAGNGGGNDSGNETGHAHGHSPRRNTGNKPGYPDPDLSVQNPPNPPAVAGGRFTRHERRLAEQDLAAYRETQPRGWSGPYYQRPADYVEPRRCPHEPQCDDREVCLQLFALARRAKVQTVVTTFGIGAES